jgi:hypothetical protein
VTYASRLRAKLDPNHPCNKSFGSQPYFGGDADDKAEQQLTGGFSTRRSNRCERCFTFKAKNGGCGCD